MILVIIHLKHIYKGPKKGLFLRCQHGTAGIIESALKFYAQNRLRCMFYAQNTEDRVIEIYKCKNKFLRKVFLVKSSNFFFYRFFSSFYKFIKIYSFL